MLLCIIRTPLLEVKLAGKTVDYTRGKTVETIIYDQNLRNDDDNQANPLWKNDNILYIIFTYYIDDFIILLL